MKRFIAILAIMMIALGAFFADTATGEVSTLNITLTIDSAQPTLTLLGRTDDDSDYEHADVAFGTLEDGTSSIDAHFIVHYTSYRCNSSITVEVTAFPLTCNDTTVTTTGAATVSEITNATMDFSEGDGTEGYFAEFTISYATANLAPGSYESTVIVTYKPV